MRKHVDMISEKATGTISNLEERGLGRIKASVPRWDNDINWCHQTNTSRGSNLMEEVTSDSRRGKPKGYLTSWQTMSIKYRLTDVMQNS